MSERPSSREFETRLILALLHDTRFREYAVGQLKNDTFTEFDCKHLYETILSLKNKKKPITFFGVYEMVRRNTKLSDDKASSICKLLEPYIGVDANTEFLSSIVDGVVPEVESLVRKRLIEVAMSQSVDLFNSEDDHSQEIIQTWDKVGQQSIYRIPEKVSFYQDLEEHKGNMKEAIQYAEGIPTGVMGDDRTMAPQWLDQTMFYKGVGRGELTIILADANIGKTTMALNIALFQSLSGFNVDYYSLEVDRRYLTARGVSMLTDIPTDDIIEDTMSKEVSKRLGKIKKKYPNRKDIEIYDGTTNSLTIDVISQNLMLSHKQGRPVDVVIVDYVDLLKSEKYYKEKRFEISQNTIDLRNLGKEYNCAVITPSKMNRGTFKDKKKFKDRTNMGEDYSKVYTSDHIWVLNEENTDATDVNGVASQQRQIKFFVDKNRFGKRGLLLTLQPDYATGRFFNPLPRGPVN